jgi:predicted metal-binding membrane protein
MTGNSAAAAGPGNPARRWERGLLAALAGLSALAWLASWRWPMPGMRAGVLTGPDMRGMGRVDDDAPMALGLFLLTWVVMMAAMMLPAAAPVVLAVDRWARRSGRSRLAAVGFLAGYLADWSVAGLGAYAVLAGLEHRYPSPGPPAVRAGAVLLVVAGIWQLTPPPGRRLPRCCRLRSA